MSRRWRIWSALLAIGAIWLGVVAARGVLGRLAFPTVARGVRPADGHPPSGAALTPEMFAAWLPPAPADALAYAIDEPLFNGAAVTLKRRWLWVPSGQAIIVDSPTASVHVPVGAKFWKEFYLRVDEPSDDERNIGGRPAEVSRSGGRERLIERRIIERVSGDDGFHGWKFYKAHYLPAVPAQRLRVPAGGESARSIASWFFRPDEWMPTQRVPQAVVVQVDDARGQATGTGYVFPGTAQCVTCHAGATGWYARDSDSLAFGLTDLLADPESRARLRQRGWLKDGGALVAPPQTDRAADETRQLVRMLRHNCMTCHNDSPNALGRRTGFVLDPRIDYDRTRLLAVLSRPGVMMGPATRSIVVPGHPDESELILRLKGELGRRRMPPEEGGVPGLHARLIERAERWILAAEPSASAAAK